MCPARGCVSATMGPVKLTDAATRAVWSAKQNITAHPGKAIEDCVGQLVLRLPIQLCAPSVRQLPENEAEKPFEDGAAGPLRPGAQKLTFTLGRCCVRLCTEIKS